MAEYLPRFQRIIVKYLVSLLLLFFFLYPGLFWELRDKRNFKNLQFWPESLGSMLEYWYIERGLFIPPIHCGSFSFVTTFQQRSSAFRATRTIFNLPKDMASHDVLKRTEWFTIRFYNKLAIFKCMHKAYNGSCLARTLINCIAKKRNLP